MQVKYFLAQGQQVDQSMMELLALARTQGQIGIGSLTNDHRNGNISLSQTRSAIVIVGGRDSIRNSLFNSGNTTHIIGNNPLRMCFARKHRIFGKNETCLKLVAGQGHQQPQDGSEFITLQTQGGAQQFLLSPTQLAHLLYSAYGW